MNYFGIGNDNYSIDYSDFEQFYNTFGDDYNCFPNTYNQFNENHLSFDNSCSSFSETYGFGDNYLNYTPSYEHLEINLNDFQSFCRDTYGSFGDASNPLGDADLLSDFDYDLYRSYNEAATSFNNYDGIETLDLSSFGLDEEASHCSAEPSAVNSPPVYEEMIINTDAVFDPMPLNSYATNSSCRIINDLDMQSYSLISEQNYFNTPYYCNITVSDLFSFGSTAHEQGPDTEISNSQDLTSYKYCLNDPVNFIDPSGLDGSYPDAKMVGGDDPLGLDILGIHSNVGPNAEFTNGHAWISYTDASGNTINYGLWPDSHPMTPNNGPGSDVRVGMENDQIPLHSRYYDLTSEQIRKWQDFVNRSDEWGYSHTCADWASDAVRDTIGENVDVDDWLGFETPRELSESIIQLERETPTSITNPLAPMQGGSSF